LLRLAEQFPDVTTINFGGGFGIGYQKGEKDVDIATIIQCYDTLITEFSNKS
jgi:diaminopimelate decarboxylase